MGILNYTEVSSNLITFLGVTCFTLYFFTPEPIIFFINISCATGQILVSKLLSVFYFVSKSLNLIFVLFQILYEDALIFGKDVIETTVYFASIIGNIFLFISQALMVAQAHIQRFQLIETFLRIMGFIQDVIVTIKQTLQFVGLHIWILFISIPKTISTYVYSVISFIKNSKNELFNIVLDLFDKIFQYLEHFYLSLCGVAFDSICGLLIGAVFMVFICVKFKDLCQLIYFTFLNVYKWFLSIANKNIWNKFLIYNNKQRSNLINSHDQNDERLCVICQFNFKEIIIFPCKHLCLCWDCSKTLTAVQPICPICRTGISETLKVYV